MAQQLRCVEPEGNRSGRPRVDGGPANHDAGGTVKLGGASDIQTVTRIEETVRTAKIIPVHGFLLSGRFQNGVFCVKANGTGYVRE